MGQFNSNLLDKSNQSLLFEYRFRYEKPTFITQFIVFNLIVNIFPFALWEYI